MMEKNYTLLWKKKRQPLWNNHPFVDGNKRLGYTLMRLVLFEQGYDVNANQKEKYNFVIGIAKGNLKYVNILKWIKEKLIKKK